MLIPKKVKHRKWHKGRGRGKRLATTKTTIAFGSYGIKAITGAWITSRQIEAARRAMTRAVKPVTSKGSEMPMGKGKGAVDHYVAVIRPGTVLFEMGGVDQELAQSALTLAAHKLPVKSKIISREVI